MPPTTDDHTKLTIKQLKDALKANNIPYEKYGLKQYYLGLYEDHIVKKLPVKEVDTTKPQDSGKKTPKSTSTTIPKRTPLSSRKLKRKNREEEDAAEKQPPSKKAKLTDEDKPTSLKISGPSREVNQLRAKHDATPLPQRAGAKSAQVKSFVSPATVTKAAESTNEAERIAGASTFVDESLLKAPEQQNAVEEDASSTSSKSSSGEPALLEEVEDISEETDETYVSEEPELKITPFIYLLRILILALLIGACFMGLTSFKTGAGSPFHSVVQLRPFCPEGVSGPECAPCPQYGICKDGRLVGCEGNKFVKNNVCVKGLENTTTNMAYAVEQYLIKTAQESTDACFGRDFSVEPDQVKSILEETKDYVGKLPALQEAIRSGLIPKLTIDANDVIHLAKSSTVMCEARRVFRIVCAHKKSIFGALTLLVMLLILVTYDDESEQISVLRSAILHKLKQGDSDSISLDAMREYVKDAATDVYNERYFDKALDELRKDPRVQFDEEDGITYRDL